MAHKHIIWDWNCTLFDDFSIILLATSATYRHFGGGDVDVELYHKHHQRPLSAMHSSLVGRELSEEEYHGGRQVFEKVYTELQDSVQLSDGAVEALGRVIDSGATQSLLSTRSSERIMEMIDRFGLEKFFTYIQGVPDGVPQIKKNFLESHIEKVLELHGDEIARSEMTLIGDCVDDAQAADAGGIGCVLYPHGLDSRENLIATGHPITDSLLEGVELALKQ